MVYLQTDHISLKKMQVNSCIKQFSMKETGTSNTDKMNDEFQNGAGKGLVCSFKYYTT